MSHALHLSQTTARHICDELCYEQISSMEEDKLYTRRDHPQNDRMGRISGSPTRPDLVELHGLTLSTPPSRPRPPGHRIPVKRPNYCSTETHRKICFETVNSFYIAFTYEKEASRAVFAADLKSNAANDSWRASFRGHCDGFQACLTIRRLAGGRACDISAPYVKRAARPRANPPPWRLQLSSNEAHELAAVVLRHTS